jgi:hypothetical protein
MDSVSFVPSVAPTIGLLTFGIRFDSFDTRSDSLTLKDRILRSTSQIPISRECNLFSETRQYEDPGTPSRLGSINKDHIKLLECPSPQLFIVFHKERFIGSQSSSGCFLE